MNLFNYLFNIGVNNLDNFIIHIDTSADLYTEFSAGAKEYYGAIIGSAWFILLIKLSKSVPSFILVLYNCYNAYKIVYVFLERRKNRKKIEEAFKRLSGSNK